MTNALLISLLIFPALIALLILLVKKRTFGNIMINLYAIVHFLSTIGIVFCNNFDNANHYFAVDNINKVFLLVLSLVFLMTAIYNNGYSKTMTNLSNKKVCLYSVMTTCFVWAMTGAILTVDLGIAWILIEATTLTSAYLIYFHRTKSSIEAAWKYVFMCSIGIALAFIGIIFLNISAGNINSLNYEALLQNAKLFNPFWLKLSFVFILFGFGTKMGLAPVHFWLPDAHSESPSPISALLSATLLNSAFLVILRIFKILSIAECSGYGKIMLAVMGFLSIFITAVFVYHIKNYKRMLAYSSIENMGILAIGTALGGSAFYAVILHLIGHSLAKASFFLTSGNILEIFETKRIKSISGLIYADKKTGWLWIASFLAICAFPTSLLFISEFIIIKTMFQKGYYVLCILFVLLLTVVLYGMAKTVLRMTFGELSKEKNEMIAQNAKKISPSMYIPQVIMLVIVFVLGIYIPPFLNEVIQNTLSAL